MEHPWFRYAPDFDPRTVFVLYDGSMNLLPVKCVTTESVDRDIQQALNAYMKHAVCVYPKEQLVCLGCCSTLVTNVLSKICLLTWYAYVWLSLVYRK